MTVSPTGGIFSSSLYKAYFGNQTTRSASASGNLVNSDAIVSQIGEVKSKLLSLAAKAKELSERQQTNQSSSSSLPPTYTTPDGVEVSISTENSSKPARFQSQISSALTRSYNSPNQDVLTNNGVEGDVKVSLKDGNNTSSFSIHVDKNTTAQDFVNQFNQKSGGKASAELTQTTVNGSDTYKINLIGAPQTPVDNSTASQTGLEADAAQFEKDVKDFASGVNKLIQTVSGNQDGLTSLNSNVGLVDSLKDVIKNLKSDDGSVSISSFVTEKSSGGYTVNGSAAREAFLNNSEGVASLLANLSDAVSGKKGLTETYAAYGGNLDKISAVVKVIGQAQDKYTSDGLSNSPEINAQREQNLLGLVSYAGKLSAL